MKKRILAVVLCLAMLLSVVPFTLTAGAAGTVNDTAKNILTVPAPGPDGNISYNNSGWNKPQGTGYYWGLARWSTTETATAPFYNQNSVEVDGEYMFATAVTEEQPCQPTYLPATYELNVCYDAKETTVVAGGKHEGELYGAQPISALHADAADYNFIAIRVKITGDTATPAYYGVGTSSANDKKCDWQNVSLINYTDCTVTTITTSGTTYNIPAGFDGWIIVPESQFQGAMAIENVTVVGFRFLSETNGKTFYQGDMKIVKDLAAFKGVHSVPVFKLEATETSITVVSDDANAVYSLDKNAAAEQWLAKDAFNATLTNLEKDKQFIVYGKYAAGTKVGSQKIWTTIDGTSSGDGALYIHKAPSAGSLSYKSYKYDWGMGWSSTGAGRLHDDSGFTTGDGTQYLFFKQVDGENFLEVQDNPDKNCVQYTIAPHWVNTGAATTVGQSFPEAANYEYIGIRLKLKGVEGQVSKLSVILRAEDGADAQYGQMAERKGSWLVDINTGVKTDIKNVAQQIPSGFDGWLIAPKSAITSADYTKSYTFADLKSILFYHHQGCGHYADGSDWNNTTLYIGDFALFDNAELFTNVRICEANGHKEATPATCNTRATCSVCKKAYGEVNPTAHGTNTELRDVVIADCKQDGYTGDTWCLDCNTKIGTGTTTPKGNHADADGKWETDGTNHWHTCSCGEILDKDAHKGGSASCSLLAVCDICKVGYGELDVDNHCDQDAKYEFNDTEHFYTCDCGKTFGNAKHEGGAATCKDKAICKVCKQPYGDVDATNHAGETEVKDAVDATCGKEGYTGDTYCKDCNTKIKDGEKIAATGNHTAAEELVNQKDATTTEKGYTGDKVCKDCGFVMEKGEDIPVLAGDDNKDEDTTTPGGDATTPDDDKTEGDSTTGGEGTDDENAGAGSEDDGNASPETGDNASILVAVLVALMAGAVVVLAKKRA
ncbi:MAG: hypothetical protein IJ370_01890 [Oscillospiraceae bacterium]|nr:hypothetical protein [Oscillospiraceae bacterium]